MPPKKRRSFGNRTQRDDRTRELTANRVYEYRRRRSQSQNEKRHQEGDNDNVTDDLDLHVGLELGRDPVEEADNQPPPLLDLDLENGNRYQNHTKKRQYRRKTDKKNIALIDLNSPNFEVDLDLHS